MAIVRARFAFPLFLLLLACAVPAGAMGTKAENDRWTWLNPRPSGNPIAAVSCAHNVCYAAGWYGTILRGEDEGRNWQKVSSGTHADFSDISCPTIHDCAALAPGMVRMTRDSGVTWTQFKAPLPDVLSSLTCPAAGVCYALGTNVTLECPVPRCHPSRPIYVLFVTLNGGVTWRRSQAGNTVTLSRVSCWAAGACLALGDQNTVYETSNAGKSWSRRDVLPGNAYVQGASCPAPEVCYLAAAPNTQGPPHFGLWYVTRDGGHTWTHSHIPGFPQYGGISCVSPLRCTVTGYRGDLLVTRNGGHGWSIKHLPLPGDPGRLSCESERVCHVVGPGSAILTTTDGGNHWTSSVRGPLDDLTHIVCPTARTCRALSPDYSSLVITDDSGATWSSRPLPAQSNTAYRPGLACPDVHTCWVVANGGTILRSDDVGVHWHAIANPLSHSQVSLQGISCPDSHTCFAAGAGCLTSGACQGTDSRGVILRTADGGAHWNEVYTQQQDTLILEAVACADAEHCVVTGSPGVTLETDDGGTTWHNAPNPESGDNVDLRAVTCVDNQHCLAVGYGCNAAGCTIEEFQGMILITADGGRTWTAHNQDIRIRIRGGGKMCGFQATCSTGIGFNGVSCQGALHCWIADDNGTLLSTANGGQSWQQEPRVTDLPLTDIACPGVSCYVSGPGGAVLRFALLPPREDLALMQAQGTPPHEGYRTP